MDTLQLETRHSKALTELKRAAEPKIKKIGLIRSTEFVGAQLGITGQTVINYYLGRGKRGDGYLTEAITEVFKKL